MCRMCRMCCQQVSALNILLSTALCRYLLTSGPDLSLLRMLSLSRAACRDRQCAYSCIFLQQLCVYVVYGANRVYAALLVDVLEKQYTDSDGLVYSPRTDSDRCMDRGMGIRAASCTHSTVRSAFLAALEGAAKCSAANLQAIKAWTLAHWSGRA
jgi:hypothetical protein